MNLVTPLSRLWILAFFLTLTLHWVAPVTLEPALWGVSSWRGVLPGWRILLWLVGLSLLFSTGARALDPVFLRPRSTGQRLIWIVPACALLFWFLRTDELWHNSAIVANAVQRFDVSLKHTLAGFLAGATAWLGRGLTDAHLGGTALSLLSVFSGCLFVLGAAALGSSLYPESRAKARVTTLLLCTAGYMQQFFGILELYALALPAQIWILVFLARMYRSSQPEGLEQEQAEGQEQGRAEGQELERAEGQELERVEGQRQGRAPCSRLLMACSASTGVFLATLYMWPSVALAVVLRGKLRPFFKPLLAVAFPLGLAILVYFLFGRDFHLSLSQMGGLDGASWVPMNRPAEMRTFHFTLFSHEHLAARLNAAFLSAPAWLPLLCAALWMKRSGPGPEPWQRALVLPLGLAALCAMSYVVLVNPDGGPVIEWMQTATGLVIPYTFLVVTALNRVSDQGAARLGTVCVGLSLLHTLPWVLVNAGAAMKKILFATGLLLLFAAAPLVLDERITTYGSVLPVKDYPTLALSNPEDSCLAVDFPARTKWKGDRLKNRSWTVIFSEPVSLTGIVVDTSNFWKERIEGLRIWIKEPGASNQVMQKHSKEKKFTSFLLCKWEQPRIAERLVLVPSRTREDRARKAPWALRNVRFLVEDDLPLDPDVYKSSLAEGIAPFVAFLLWILFLRRKKGPTPPIS